MSDNKNYDINYKKLGRRIREKRIESNLTQVQLAKKSNISAKHLSNIEANNAKSIGIKALIAIADNLNTSLDYLLSDTFENNEVLTDKEIRKMLSEMTSRQRIFAMDSIKMILDNKDNFK